MKKAWKEFKEFAIKGNAIDLAVGVIIGAAFGGIINSLVKDVVMPPVSLLTGGLDFSNKFIVLRAAKDGSIGFNTPADAAKAGAISLLVRAMNRLKQPKHAEPVTKDCPACAMTIPVKASRCPHCTTEFSRQSPV